MAAYWNAVLSVNEYQVSRFFRKITAHYCETLRGKRLALLGCAFKKGTPDVMYVASFPLGHLYDNEYRVSALFSLHMS